MSVTHMKSGSIEEWVRRSKNRANDRKILYLASRQTLGNTRKDVDGTSHSQSR